MRISISINVDPGEQPPDPAAIVKSFVASRSLPDGEVTCAVVQMAQNDAPQAQKA